ncbi:oxidoreductase [Mycobacterium scrofulaceum]|uniref:Oxidoreductase n=1 Tax=Mycobacterium scrofulaceum TaxID=1783 RepID=A0A1A2UTI2_MYCSC|nr:MULTISPECIES: ferredoxin reductase [Mycobacterium]OBG73651.1 oxidoreductase [Mycobacterium sp. E3298]OBH91547.1 oxidoreductase [Mycobacterium scrofulaceum]
MDGHLRPKLRWRVARVVDSEPETESAHTIELTVPGWGGHLAGQHIDLKLTAADGYTAQRSYSLSKPPDGERIELTVQQIPDGEVSPYLVGLVAGDEVELRGPIGGWFVWQPDDDAARVLLIGGGSGIVPLMAMLRQRVVAGSADFRLVYSVRSPGDVYYAQELSRLERECGWLQVGLVYTRVAPAEATRPPGRVRIADMASEWASIVGTRVYVCGPTGFVESVTAMLIEQGHQPSAIRTERFGPSSQSGSEEW